MYIRTVLFEKTKQNIETRFIELCNGFVIKVDEEKFIDYIFYFKDDASLFQYNLKTGHFWCSHQHYWSVFENEYGLNHTEIQEFTKDMVEKHFKTKELTPQSQVGELPTMAEKHFNLCEATKCNEV